MQFAMSPTNAVNRSAYCSCSIPCTAKTAAALSLMVARLCRDVFAGDDVGSLLLNDGMAVADAAPQSNRRIRIACCVNCEDARCKM